MRIISGSARGIKLDTLEGLETRPTTDKVKGAIFSMIQSDIYQSNALDLFSGSGALGIELLSRGANHVTFVESNRALKSIIEGNLKKANLEQQAKLYTNDVYQTLDQLKGNQFQIIIMDPPYLKGHVKKCLDCVESLQLLSVNGVMVIEHDITDTEILSHSEYFESLKTKKYGKIGVTVFRRQI